MNILYASVLFLMGLLSSSEWFQIFPETSVSSPAFANKHKCNNIFKRGTVVLIVKETCPMTTSKSKVYNISTKVQEMETHPITYKVLWPLTSDKTSIKLSENAADTILISINSPVQNELHHRIGLPGKILIQLEE